MNNNRPTFEAFTETRLRTGETKYIVIHMDSKEVVYEAPTLKIAEDIAKQWNTVGVTWNNDGTLNLESI